MRAVVMKDALLRVQDVPEPVRGSGEFLGIAISRLSHAPWNSSREIKGRLRAADGQTCRRPALRNSGHRRGGCEFPNSALAGW